MSPLYSRAGDNGMTDLLGEGRVAKSDLRIEVLGALDEASAALGLARSLSDVDDVKAVIVELQRGLYTSWPRLQPQPKMPTHSNQSGRNK